MLVIKIRSLVDPFLVGENTTITLWIAPGAIGIPLPPPTSDSGGSCFGDVTLAISVPKPVFLIVMLAEAVLLGAAARPIAFRLTAICPGPVGVDVGVADGVAVGVGVEVAVGVAVALAVAVIDDVEVAVAVAVFVDVTVPVDVGVAVAVAVAAGVVPVAVAVGVAATVAVEVAVAVEVDDEVGVAIPSGMLYASTRLF